jgi:hypothetical protein
VSGSQQVAEFWEFNEGSYRMVCFFMLSCLIFSSSDDRGIPNLAAAPFGTATFPLLSANEFDELLLIVLDGLYERT